MLPPKVIDATEPKTPIESYIEQTYFAQRRQPDLAWLRDYIHTPEGQKFVSRFGQAFEPQLIRALGRAFGVSAKPATTPEAARDETEKLRLIEATLYYVADKGFPEAYYDIPELESAINELTEQLPLKFDSTSDPAQPLKIPASRRQILQIMSMGVGGLAVVVDQFNSIESNDPYRKIKEVASGMAFSATTYLTSRFCNNLSVDFQKAIESGNVHNVTPLIDDWWLCKEPEKMNSQKHVDALFVYMEKWTQMVKEIHGLMGKKPVIKHIQDNETGAIGDYRHAVRGR